MSYVTASYSGIATTAASSSALSDGIVFVDTNTLYLKYARTGASFKFSDFLSNAGGVLNFTGIFSGGVAINTTNNYSGTLTGIPQATAVPEPEAYAMMLAGLGLVGFAARRQQKSA